MHKITILQIFKTKTIPVITRSKFDMSIVVNTFNSGKVGYIDPVTGQFTQIAVLSGSITDVAVDSDGTIFAISFNQLYRINRSNGTALLIGTLGASSFNALEFSTDGRLWGISESSLYQINPRTAQTTFIFNLGFTSSGDLAFDGLNNRFFAVGENSFSGNDFLYSIQLSSSSNTVTGVAQIGNIGYSDVWGLALVGRTLYGYTSSRQEIVINTSTGVGSFSKNLNGLVGDDVGGADDYPDWIIKGTGDFNRDGNIDILWHNPTTNQNGAWLMNSNGVNVGWQGMAGNPTGWEIKGTGDFNRDGNIDILWHNPTTNQNGAWLMNSNGVNIGWLGMSPNP
jgi:hypothetical protein